MIIIAAQGNSRNAHKSCNKQMQQPIFCVKNLPVQIHEGIAALQQLQYKSTTKIQMQHHMSERTHIPWT